MTSASTTVAPIGSSMLDFIDNGGLPGENDTTIPTTKKTYNLNPTAALLATVSAATQETTKKPPRLLVRGPNQSGRTSLLMEIANAIASDPPSCAKCQGARKKSCQCVAVTMIVHAKKTRKNASSFPLVCRRRQDVLPNDDLESKLLAIEREHYHSPVTWSNNAESLARIQVQHLTSLRAVLAYLLSIQARPQHEQPWGALIIDDIESFVQSGDHSSEALSTDQLMDIIKILAILEDTTNYLERLYPSIALYVTMKSSFGLPTNIDRMLTNWLPRTVSLVSSVKPFVNMKEEGDTVESSWKAELAGSNSMVCFPFNLVRKSDGSLYLLWTHKAV